MKNLFFKPYIGTGLTVGSARMNILVVGASFYCNRTECRFYGECTSVSGKDSSRFDQECPYNNGIPLSESPEAEITSGNRTYSAFANEVIRACDLDMDKKEFLSGISFTNYVQFMLPCEDKGTAGKTTQRDLEAFRAVLKMVEPDFVIMWGSEISSDIRKEATDPETLADSGNYFFHIDVDGRSVPVLNTAHPADSFRFYGEDNRRAIAKYLGTFM